MSYEDEEESIIEDDTLSEKGRKRALSDLYWEGVGQCQDQSDEESWQNGYH